MCKVGGGIYIFFPPFELTVSFNRNKFRLNETWLNPGVCNFNVSRILIIVFGGGGAVFSTFCYFYESTFYNSN